jgi:hypothetical protein
MAQAHGVSPHYIAIQICGGPVWFTPETLVDNLLYYSRWSSYNGVFAEDEAFWINNSRSGSMGYQQVSRALPEG